MDSSLRNGEARIELNGVIHWYKVAGAGRSATPILVIHGGPGGNVYNFERTIGPKLESFATLIYYEQRGCGRSASPEDPNGYSIPLLLSDLDLLCQKLEVAKIIPLGFSFGGELALEYALANPQRVEKLILQAPSIGKSERSACVQLDGFRTVARGTVAREIQTIISEQGSPGERLQRVWEVVDTATVDHFLFQDDAVAKINRRLWQESGLENTGQMHAALDAQPTGVPLLNRIQGIQAATLVLIGLYDRNVGVDTARDIAALIPQAQLILFERSAHFPEMEEPEKYAQSVRSFFFGQSHG